MIDNKIGHSKIPIKFWDFSLFKALTQLNSGVDPGRNGMARGSKRATVPHWLMISYVDVSGTFPARHAPLEGRQTETRRFLRKAKK